MTVGGVATWVFDPADVGTVASSTNLAPLTAVDGDLVFVQSRRMFVRFAAGQALALSVDVFAGTGGQWNRLQFPDVSWASQAAWFLDANAGNDDNSGLTNVTALKSAAELVRRINGQTLQQAVTVTQLTDLNEWVTLEVNILNSAGSTPDFFWLGDQSAWTSLHAGTLSAATALNAATNTPPDVTDAGIGDWTTAGPAGSSLISHRIRLTSGAAGVVGSTAWLIKSTAPTVARTSVWQLFSPTAPTTLNPAPVTIAGNENYVVERLPGINGLDIRIRRLTAPATNVAAGIMIDSVEVGKGLADVNNSSVYLQADQFAVQSVISRSRTACSRIVSLPLRLCSVIGCGAPQQISFSGQLIVVGGSIIGNLVQGNGSLLQLQQAFIVQSGQLRVTNPTIISTNGAGIFDSASDGVSLALQAVNARLEVDDGRPLFGAGNTGFGINVAAGSLVMFGTTKPNVTGASGDTQVGGTTFAYAAIPFVNTAKLCGIVQR